MDQNFQFDVFTHCKTADALPAALIDLRREVAIEVLNDIDRVSKNLSTMAGMERFRTGLWEIRKKFGISNGDEGDE